MNQRRAAGLADRSMCRERSALFLVDPSALRARRRFPRSVAWYSLWTVSNPEKPSELAVRDWLETAYGGVTRPCSDPPDYVVDGRFAVEVTELHQHVAGVPEKTIACPVSRTAFAAFADKSPKPSLGRLIVHCEYSLDSPPPKQQLHLELQEALRDFTDEDRSVPLRPSDRPYWNRARHLDGPVGPSLHICLPSGLCIDFFPCAGPPAFITGVHGPDEGCLPLSELISSAGTAIPDKTSRVLRVAPQYPAYHWCLVLVDRIGLGVPTEGDLDSFSAAISVPAFWRRVLFFDTARRPHELFSAS